MVGRPGRRRHRRATARDSSRSEGASARPRPGKARRDERARQNRGSHDPHVFRRQPRGGWSCRWPPRAPSRAGTREGRRDARSPIDRASRRCTFDTTDVPSQACTQGADGSTNPQLPPRPVPRSSRGRGANDRLCVACSTCDAVQKPGNARGRGFRRRARPSRPAWLHRGTGPGSGWRPPGHRSSAMGCTSEHEGQRWSAGTDRACRSGHCPRRGRYRPGSRTRPVRWVPRDRSRVLDGTADRGRRRCAALSHSRDPRRGRHI